MNYEFLLSSVENKFSCTPVSASDLPYLQTLLNRYHLVALLKDILSKQDLLNKICARSYTHALGFDKIVLLDLSKDTPNSKQKTQVRLHIWDPINTHALPIVESLHEHSFDFVSTIISGHLENQQFKLSALNDAQKSLLSRLKSRLSTLSQQDTLFLNDQLEIIDAIKLDALGSKQLSELRMLSHFNIDKCISLLNMSHSEVYALSALQGHYVSNRVPGQRGAYKHILSDYCSLQPHHVMRLSEGQHYFHPYQLPHRLYYDNKILNSTLLLTTAVPQNPEGGSLQRPTYVNSNEKDYDKISHTPENFRAHLLKYLDFLQS